MQLTQQFVQDFLRLFRTDSLSSGWQDTFKASSFWIYILSAVSILLTYLTIPIALVFLCLKRSKISAHKFFWLFPALVLVCGTLHLWNILVIQRHITHLSSMIYFWTALISWLSIFAFFKMLPDTFKLKTPTQLEKLLQQRTWELNEATKKTRFYAYQLAKSHRELEEFTTIAAHDLQMPLRKVQLFGDRLKQQAEQALDTASVDYLNRIQHATCHMQELITDLLHLSRITQTIKPFSKTNLSILILDVLENLQESIQKVHGQVLLEELGIIETDPTQIRLLFQNLLDNALKFRKEGVRPLIHITSNMLKNDTCEIRVQDNGIGFKSEHQDRIFMTFEKLHGEKYEGTGIGLSLCKRIAESHGGSIRAESRENEGSVFIICLPVRQIKMENSLHLLN